MPTARLDHGQAVLPKNGALTTILGMANVYEDPRLAGVYQRGNEMPEASLRDWTHLIGSFTEHPTPAVVEIGAGTGMFCSAMARWLNPSAVVGIDASVPMLIQAHRFNSHPVVQYAVGTAEAVPTGSHLFDLALLSRVIHHLPDRARVAGELGRILRPGGVVVIRTTFRERLDALVYDYWPQLRALDEQRFPAESEVLDDFAAAGFTVRTVTSFARPVTASLRDYHARMTSQPQSKFTQLTAGEFQDGLRRLEIDAQDESLTRPVAVVERHDVAALSRA
ncbi:class I SAM-dependent methyltransferase [Streptomyces zagrosensis]|uniref:Ubiquinone/menaquinone biosynthesis C-methylase UbiE n=1 Tax=Streptomyces zagrosensis TaxID=1042984 RepID=A0A7W9V1Z8_9ACTN|nr:class I SAM-dependent methyltransferase [Streptomyces zagrosensis]MBB5939735.1 ubiquinone/menaquinone biosynthesis C-methylase UbiE [Streptomyces zagrosensis]